MAIANWPESERPRERLLSLGAASLSDAELVAVLLRTGVRGKSAVDLGREEDPRAERHARGAGAPRHDRAEAPADEPHPLERDLAPERLGQLVDGQRPVAQRVEQTNAHRFTDDPEALGDELDERLRKRVRNGDWLSHEHNYTIEQLL